jgi:phenolic acid decarboxylase
MEDCRHEPCIAQEPQKTVSFQNEHLDLMRRYRDACPTYPTLVIDEFARITFREDSGRDDQDVIACGVDKLPEGYAARRN